MDAKTRIEELKKTLEYHSNRYYNMDDPITQTKRT